MPQEASEEFPDSAPSGMIASLFTPGPPRRGRALLKDQLYRPLSRKKQRLQRWRAIPALRCAAAMAAAAAAFGLTCVFRLSFPGTTLQVPFFLCAIVFSSWFGGFRAGLLTTALSLVSISTFFLPPGRTALSVEEFPRLALHFIAGAGISWLGGLLRREEEGLLHSLEGLEETVRERTADLQEVNERLSAEVAERMRGQEELLRLNRALRVRSVCNWSIIRSPEEEQLLHRVCRGVVHAGEYRCARIHCAAPGGGEGEKLESNSCARYTGRAREEREEEEREEPPPWEPGEYELALAGEASREGRPQICHDLRPLPLSTPWRKWAAQSGLCSVAAFPLHGGGGLIGVLLVYSEKPEDFDRRETGLLQMTAHDVARGVALLRSREARRRTEEELKAKEAELTRVARATVMGELTASIAHEVNQPLAAVATNAGACRRWLAAETPNVEEAQAAVQRITRDVKRAAEVVQRIRGLFVKGRGEEEEVRTPADLNGVVEEVAAMLEGEINRRGAVLEWEPSEGLPAVRMDRVQIQQILMNLVLNGLDAMEGVEGRAHVLRLRTGLLSATERGGECVFVRVEDSGTGISEEQRGRLFDSFFTTKAHGLGMGLSISRSIAEAHGGRLEAEAARGGNGALFRFTLPLETEGKRPGSGGHGTS